LVHHLVLNVFSHGHHCVAFLTLVQCYEEVGQCLGVMGIECCCPLPSLECILSLSHFLV
uniref:Ovule protein n=1 Tax=Haemonchus placei TaxID=6290 RepID=A0A0N4W064_HAEPC